MLAGNANAENYFFSVNGAGDQDGTSWENAAPADYLASTVAGLNPGDAVFIQGGTYLPDRNTGLWDIPQGVSIKGGYGPEMKGTDTTITYPTATETIFTADIDGDGKGDNGARALIVIANELTDGWKGDKTWQDYDKVSISGVTIRDAYYTGESTYKGAALFMVQANVELNFVKFLNNETTVGGGVVCAQGSRAVFRDCIWRGNKGTNAGVALLCRQHNGGSSEAETRRGETIIDRCEFTDNTVAEPDNSNKAKYGGAIALADWGGTMYINNTSVTGTHISWAGAMGRFGTGTTLYTTNNTFYNCTCSYDVRHSGSIISMGDKSHLYAANTISVNPVDGFDGMLATNYIQTDKCTFDTKGYNVWGSTFNNSATPFAATDNVNKDNTMAVVFGTNTAKEVDGMNVIAPLESFRGVVLADIQTAVAGWSMPAEIDVTLDQTGAKRPASTIPGAYDVLAKKETSGIEAVAGKASEFSLKALGAGLYAVNGAEGEAAVYDLGGRKVMAAAIAEGDILDLSALAGGIYIVSLEGKAVKVAL